MKIPHIEYPVIVSKVVEFKIIDNDKIAKGSDIRCPDGHLVYKLFVDAPHGSVKEMFNPNRFVDIYNRVPTGGLRYQCPTCNATKGFYLRYKGQHILT